MSNHRRAVAGLLLAAFLVPVTVTICRGQIGGEGPDLYERTLRADLVILGRVVDGELKLAEIEILERLRGDHPEDRLIVAFRHLNATRRRWEKRIVFPNDEVVILFLKRGRLPKSDRIVYEPVRREHGKLVPPGEGSAGLLDAIRTFAAVADRPAGEHWDLLRGLLEDGNPQVVSTVLKQFEKHHLATQEETTALLRILRQGGVEDRARAARILGQLLREVRTRGDVLAREKDVINLLITSARTDPSVGIRTWAVRTLKDWASPQAIEALELISETDPPQEVRFEAERCLYQLRHDSPSAGSSH